MSIHSLACYPQEFLECVVSENKICIQFKTNQVKVRIKDRDYKSCYPGINGDWLYPISNARTDLDIVAIGLPLTEHRSLLLGLLESYEQHIDTYPDKLLVLDLLDVYNRLHTLLIDKGVNQDLLANQEP